MPRLKPVVESHSCWIPAMLLSLLDRSSSGEQTICTGAMATTLAHPDDLTLAELDQTAHAFLVGD